MSQNPRPSPYDRVRPWLPWLIFLFAFGIRLIGIGWGLPNALHNQSYHPDEQVNFSFAQGVDIGHFQFLPGHYNYGTLYFTILSLISKVVSGYGGGPKPNDLQSFWAFTGNVDLVARVLTAATGAGMAVVLFLMLRRFTRTFGALAGALLIAVAPALVVHSRFETVDVLATFFIALSLYNALKLLPATFGAETGCAPVPLEGNERSESGGFQPARRDRTESDGSSSPRSGIGSGFARLRNAGWKPAHPVSASERSVAASTIFKYAILAGLFAGLSAGTKYTGILALISLIVACALSKDANRWKACISGILVSVLAFLMSTPGAIFDYANFMRDFKYEMWHSATGQDLFFVGYNGFAYHILNLMVGIGSLAVLVGAIGVGALVIRKRQWIWVLLSFSIAYYILIGRAEVLFLRYTFPLYIVLAVGFGVLMGYAHTFKGKWRMMVVAGILAGGWSTAQMAQLTVLMATEDPRDSVALAFRNLAKTSPGTTVGIVSDPWYYTPPLIPDSAIMRGFMTQQKQEMEKSTDPKLEQYFPPNLNDRFDWDSRLVTDLKPEYIIYSSFESYDPARLEAVSGLDSISQLKVDRFKKFQSFLQASYSQVGFMPSFNPTWHIPDLEYIHPDFAIWKRKS